MSVDEALTYIVSMGVIVPGGPRNAAIETVPAQQPPADPAT